MSFAPSFYYFAMVLNFILRFFWLIGVFHLKVAKDPDGLWNEFKILSMMSIAAECLRRTVWAIIRVENEMFNNFEEYRSIPKIPSLMNRIGTIDKEELKTLKAQYK